MSSCNNVTACLASAVDGLEGDKEIVTYLNATAATKTVFVQVSTGGRAACRPSSLSREETVKNHPRAGGQDWRV